MAAKRPLKIGITCYPSVGGSGILASALGVELALLGGGLRGAGDLGHVFHAPAEPDGADRLGSAGAGRTGDTGDCQRHLRVRMRGNARKHLNAELLLQRFIALQKSNAELRLGEVLGQRPRAHVRLGLGRGGLHKTVVAAVPVLA